MRDASKLEALLHDSDSSIRKAAMDRLDKVVTDTDKKLSILLHQLALYYPDNAPLDVSLWAITKIDKLVTAPEKKLSILSDALGSSNSHFRVWADERIRGLALAGDSRVIDKLREIVRTSQNREKVHEFNPPYTEEAAEILAERGEKLAVETLIENIHFSDDPKRTFELMHKAGASTEDIINGCVNLFNDLYEDEGHPEDRQKRRSEMAWEIERLDLACIKDRNIIETLARLLRWFDVYHHETAFNKISDALNTFGDDRGKYIYEFNVDENSPTKILRSDSRLLRTSKTDLQNQINFIVQLKEAFAKRQKMKPSQIFGSNYYIMKGFSSGERCPNEKLWRTFRAMTQFESGVLLHLSSGDLMIDGLDTDWFEKWLNKWEAELRHASAAQR